MVLKMGLPILLSMAIMINAPTEMMQEKKEVQKDTQTQSERTIEKKKVKTKYKRTLNLPTDKDTSFKAYMDFRTITDVNSEQYRMQTTAYTSENGVRMIGDSYCAAIGTGYEGKLGDEFEVTLSTGAEFKIILADIKADAHTDATNRYTEMSGDRANVIEFIVQDECLPSIVTTMGNLDHMPGDIFSGDIVSMREVL